MEVTNRERFKSIARFQSPGDLFVADMVYEGAVESWVQQGAPEQMLPGGGNIYDILYGNRFFKNYFQHGRKRYITEIRSGLGGGDGGPLFPGYERRVISEDEQTVTYVGGGGQTIKSIKDRFSMPMFLDWPVKDRATWNEHKKKLDPGTPGRWPADWDALVEELNGQDDPVVLEVGGFYGYLRDWIGSENILYMFYDDPVLIEDMMEQMLYLETEIIKRVVKDIKIDEADFWEDMAYKAGPFISPDMVRKFMVPRYKKITELLRSNGVDIIYVDCDGSVEQLVPIWLESGINYIWPLEQTAGNDAVALRKKYGKDLILGGAIDKRALAKGKEAIEKEVLSKVPFLLEQGGYFPSVDHLVPPDVSFENYCHYMNTLRNVAGLEKLSF